MTRHQLIRLGFGAVDQHQPARPCRQQRPQRASTRAASANQQHIAASQQHAGIVLDVIDQSNAIGVVGVNRALVKHQRVGGLRQLRPVALAAGGLKSLELERHRDVAAACAVLHQLRQRGHKSVEWREPGLVIHGLPRQFGKTCMNLRRLAVGYRVAEHEIVIHCRVFAGH